MYTNNPYLEYQLLSPTDEQVVFRDVMRRLYSPILNNWGILSHKRDIKPEEEYIQIFDLKDWQMVDNIAEIEKKAMYILTKGGVFSGFRPRHEKLELPRKSFFRSESIIVYSFSFTVGKPETFFELYEKIFKSKHSKRENKNNEEITPEKVNSREGLDFNEKTGVLRIKKTGEEILKCRAESIPRLLLESIFSGENNTVTLNEIRKQKKINPSTTVPNSIKGSIKKGIQEVLFIIDTNSIELKKYFDMDQLLKELTKNK